MSAEIERRFLVVVDEGSFAGAPEPAPLWQGYVVAGDPSVRVRFGEARGPVLTVKSGSGIRRDEHEQVLDADVADALWRASGGRTLAKDRFQLERWSVDRFRDRFEGLWLAEVELDHEDEPLPPAPPGVRFVREVTDDPTFVSAVLVGMDGPTARALVKRAYRDVR